MDSWIRGFLVRTQLWKHDANGKHPKYHFSRSSTLKELSGAGCDRCLVAWLLGQVRVREAMATRKRSHGNKYRRRLLHLQLALWRGGIIVVRAVPG